LSVTGIDISTEMVAKLHAKPGGASLPVSMGNFAEVDVEGRFGLIYLIFNTLFGLLDQDEQVRCFANVARHLEGEGRFLIEAFVPDLGRFDRSQRVQVNQIDVDRVTIDVSRLDLARQRVTAQWVELREDGVKLLPVTIRYAWPAEIDLMARLAGLELEHRWGGWQKEAFGSESVRHVSVYKVSRS
jgi:SAM-dependent methyltransferase